MLVTPPRGPDLLQLDECAPVFAALGDEVRLKLIEALSESGIQSITVLTRGLQLSGTRISRQGVTKHLRILESAGWAREVKVGRERLWKFDTLRLADAYRSLEAILRQEKDQE